MSLTDWARCMASHFLTDAMPRRWAHVQGVASRAEELTGLLSPADGEVLVAAAWLHDIGYADELVDTDFHPLDGANYLAAQNVDCRLCGLVAHHSGAAAVADERGLSDRLAAFDDEHTVVRDALWYSDMITGPDGRAVSFDQRISELRARRGDTHPTVRALRHNLGERAAAVQRIQQLLRTARASVTAPS